MSKKRRRKKSGKRTLYYLMFSLLAVITLVILSNTVLFNLERVVIEGERDYSDDEIIAASGLEPGKNLFRTDLRLAGERILAALPKLDGAQCAISLPSSIVVTVKPAAAMAYVHTGNAAEFYQVSNGGRVMDVVTNPKSVKQVIIAGLEPEQAVPGEALVSSDEDKLAFLFTITDALNRTGSDYITSVDMTDLLSVEAYTRAGVKILLGKPFDLEEKLAVAKTLVAGELAGVKGVLDVTNPDQAVFLPET